MAKAKANPNPNIDHIAGIISGHMQAAVQYEAEASPLSWDAWIASKRAEFAGINASDGFSFDAIYGGEGPQNWTHVEGCTLNAADFEAAWQQGLAEALA